MLSTLPPRIFRSIQPPQKLSYLKYKRPMVPLHSELANYGVGDLSRISWLGVHQRGGVYKAGTGCLNPERCTLSIGRCLHPRWSRQCTLPRAEGPTSSRALHSKSQTPQPPTGAAGASRGGVRLCALSERESKHIVFLPPPPPSLSFSLPPPPSLSFAPSPPRSHTLPPPSPRRRR